MIAGKAILAMETFLYWSLLVASVPAGLAFLAWFWSARRLRKRHEAAAAIFLAVGFVGSVFAAKGFHEAHLQGRQAPESALLLVAVSAAAFLLSRVVPALARKTDRFI